MPSEPLDFLKEYEIKIKKNIESVDGKTLEKDLTLHFTTVDPNKKFALMIFEAGTNISLGKFTVKDTTIDSNTSIFNPSLSFEYQLPSGKIAAGTAFSRIKNKMFGEWTKNDKDGSGSYEVDRKEFSLFLRLGSDSTNLKAGYCYFGYKFDEGSIDMTSNGTTVEEIRNASAESKMKKGLFAEINVSAGERFRFALGLKYAYFFKAEYKLIYDKRVLVPSVTETSVNATAKLSAHSVRIRPELSFLAIDDFRVFVNATIAASIWTGEISIFDDLNSYPGVDAYSGIGAGVRYYF